MRPGLYRRFQAIADIEDESFIRSMFATIRISRIHSRSETHLPQFVEYGFASLRSSTDLIDHVPGVAPDKLNSHYVTRYTAKIGGHRFRRCGRTVEIPEGILHPRRLRNLAWKLKPI